MGKNVKGLPADLVIDICSGFVSAIEASIANPGEHKLTERQIQIAIKAIAVALRCDACIYTRAEKAVKAGATRQQVIEAGGVAVMMQGGLTYTCLPKLVEALDALDARRPRRFA